MDPSGLAAAKRTLLYQLRLWLPDSVAFLFAQQIYSLSNHSINGEFTGQAQVPRIVDWIHLAISSLSPSQVTSIVLHVLDATPLLSAQHILLQYVSSLSQEERLGFILCLLQPLPHSTIDFIKSCHAKPPFEWSDLITNHLGQFQFYLELP